MKIFTLTKKHLILILGIFLIVIIIVLSSIFQPVSFAMELTQSSIIDEAFSQKFASLYNKDEKIAYLTFDDGPTQKATAKILDILKEENVKATFFVVGKHVKENPNLVKREYEEGHYIANHGYNHNNKLLYQSTESFMNEVKQTDEEIGKAIGIPNYCSHIFRFPNGYMSPIYKSKKIMAVKALNEMNYVYVDWNCLNKDSERKYSNYALLKNLKESCKNKGNLIILMHDTADVNNTYDVLHDSIVYLKSQGYEFQNFYSLL